MTVHYFELPVELGPYGDTTLTLKIEGQYVPGTKAYTPMGEFAPTEPPEPEMFEFHHIQSADGHLLPNWLIDNIDWDEVQQVICQEYHS